MENRESTPVAGTAGADVPREADVIAVCVSERKGTRKVPVEAIELAVGTTLAAGSALLAVTQIGKKCHNDCEIKRLTGKCAMPSEGIFAIVIRGGVVRAGDKVRVVEVCER